jgi:hypothetical protein
MNWSKDLQAKGYLGGFTQSFQYERSLGANFSGVLEQRLHLGAERQEGELSAGLRFASRSSGISASATAFYRGGLDTLAAKHNALMRRVAERAHTRMKEVMNTPVTDSQLAPLASAAREALPLPTAGKLRAYLPFQDRTPERTGLTLGIGYTSGSFSLGASVTAVNEQPLRANFTARWAYR